MAGAASAVEDPRCLDAFGRLDEQRLDETAESVEPEVVAFGPCRCFEQTIHAIETGNSNCQENVDDA